MKNQKVAKVAGLGWANRALSGRKGGRLLAGNQLVALADDLVAAIQDAAWLTYYKEPNLHRPTPHMEIAIANYLAYKHENGL